MLREPRTPWPEYVEVRPQVPPALDGAAAVITFVGHATFLIQTAAGNILTDPMYSQRASPLGLLGNGRLVRWPLQLIAEGIDEPARALDEAGRARNVPLSRFRIPGFGESLRAG